MAKFVKSSPAKLTKPRRRTRHPKSGPWLLQDAKARFSELVRRVRSEGPQRVTVHGRDEVVVISAEEFRRLCRSLLPRSELRVSRSSISALPPIIFFASSLSPQ